MKTKFQRLRPAPTVNTNWKPPAVCVGGEAGCTHLVSEHNQFGCCYADGDGPCPCLFPADYMKEDDGEDIRVSEDA